MSETHLTPKQQILLWVLLTRGGGALQKDIEPFVDAKDRRALEKLGYVSTSKQKRANFIELTDRGWRDLGDIEPRLFQEGEPRISADRRMLQFVLASLSVFARRKNYTLNEIFAPAKPELGADAPAREPSGAPIEQQIRDAFFAIAGRPARDNVRLGVLREKLKHIDRKDLDAALIAMREKRTAQLMNLDNPRDIESEGDAALKSGSHAFHLLWIDQ
jgi:DNA-binding PadR family transcriptional regulator